MTPTNTLRARFLAHALAGVALAGVGCSAEAGSLPEAAAPTGVEAATDASAATRAEAATTARTAPPEPSTEPSTGPSTEPSTGPSTGPPPASAPVRTLPEGDTRTLSAVPPVAGPTPPRLPRPSLRPAPESVALDALQRWSREDLGRMRGDHLILLTLADARDAAWPQADGDDCPVQLAPVTRNPRMRRSLTRYPELAEALEERFGEPMCLYFVSHFYPPEASEHPGRGRPLVDAGAVRVASVRRTSAWLPRA